MAVLALLGCQAEPPAKPIADGPSPEGTDTGSATPGDGGESGGSESEGGETSEAPTASDGLGIARVTANQAAQCDINREGDPVGAGMRTATLISGRDTLVRAHLLRGEDFGEREIKVVLTLTNLDGAEHVLPTTLWVDRDSSDADLTSTPRWLVSAESASSGTYYSIELLELDDTPLVAPSPLSPAQVSGELGVVDDRHELEVVIVPIQHVLDGCDQTPELEATDLEYLAAGLAQVYPVDAVSFDVHEPFPWTESFPDASFSPLLDELRQLREDDQARPNDHYYGLLWSCDGSPVGIDGQASGYPHPVTSHDYLRVSAGKWFGPEPKTLRPMIHELGHSLGRRHVECRGDEPDPDEYFPHADGLIGAWGFGLDDGELRDPLEYHEFMSYCGTTWTSDYGWNVAERTIATLTSWDGRALASGGRPLLLGSLYSDGTARWEIIEGEPFDDERDGAYVLEIDRGDGNPLKTPVAAATRPDGNTLVFSAALPPDLRTPQSAVLVHGTSRLPVRLDGTRHEL